MGFVVPLLFFVVGHSKRSPACYGGRCCCRCCKLLLSFLVNVSRSGSIVVVGDPIFANVSGFGVVVAEGDRLGGPSLYRGESSKMGQSDQIT